MASKKVFSLDTPKDTTTTISNSEGKTTAKFTWNSTCKTSLENGLGNAQEYVDSECIRYMNSLTPRLTGVLIKSVTLGTTIGSGELDYVAVYARRQYYENASKSMWFETMKNRNKSTILEGARKVAASR